MIQLLLPKPRLPHPHSSHLCRSRHGIWYVRHVVPSDIRAQHLHLAKEIRRSAGTSATRLAKRLARDFLGQFVRGLAAIGLDMPNSNGDRLDNILKGLMPGGNVTRHRAAGHPLVAPMVMAKTTQSGAASTNSKPLRIRRAAVEFNSSTTRFANEATSSSKHPHAAAHRHQRPDRPRNAFQGGCHPG